MPPGSATTRPRTRVTLTPPEDLSDGVQLSEGAWEVPDEEEGTRITEKPPNIPKPTVSQHANQLRERVRELAAKTPSRPKLSTRSGVKRPRTSVEAFISTVWSIGARMVQPLAWPVANVLAIQSPIAGSILEDAVRNTAVDTILQPVARVFKGGDTAFALLGPPLLTAVAYAKPDSQPIVEPMLREALKSWLKVAGPKLAEKAKEEAAFQEEFGSTIDDLVKFIFTPPPGTVVDDTVHSGQTQQA